MTAPVKPPLTASRSIRPLIVATLGILVLTVMDAAVKALAARHTVVEIALARYLFGAGFALAIAAYVGMKRPSAATLRAHLLRTSFVVSTAILFFTALARLPMTEALTISFIAPALVAVFARFILGEAVSRLTIVSIAVCFLGVLVIAREDMAHWKNPAEDAIGLFAAIGAAFTYAMALVLLRQRAQADGLVTTVTMQNLIAIAYLTPIAAAWTGRVPLDGLIAEWPTLIVIGGLGTMGHLMLAYAYSQAVAARIGAVEYSGLIWAVIIGFFWFGEWPTPSTLAGAALIVGGSSLLLYRGK
ncbi:MAG: DMT family transporter [Methylobacteriaceae bacterium]|nr:DMT family transporter [Methylobacteriaceae bacterium]